MGGSFILAINLALGAAIMISFLAFGFYDRPQKAPFWFFAACLTGVVAGAIEYTLPVLESTALPRFLIFSIFAVSVACLSAGLASRYAGHVPWRVLAAGLVFALVSYGSIAEMPRQSLVRSFFYQAPYAVLQGIGIYYVIGGMSRSLLDRAIVAGLTFNALQYLARPFLLHALGGNGARAQDYLSTDYAMASQTLMAIATILIAVLLGMRLFVDLMTKLLDRSEIDSLSTMLNRPGFARLVDVALAPRNRNGLPVTLVLCDLDHFKAINDTFGHQAGDDVIAGFGRLIGANKRQQDLSGRIGGEEFAILLHNCDIAGGRLFAENLRLSLESADLLPQHDMPCTASFGVAEVLPGSSFRIAFARADEALYRAKRSGRNRVETAGEPGQAPLRANARDSRDLIARGRSRLSS